MRKEDLIKAIISRHRRETNKSSSGIRSHLPAGKPGQIPNSPPVLRSKSVQRRIRAVQEANRQDKDLSSGCFEGDERLLLMVRDACWLQATWDIPPSAVERAQAALAEHWHSAQPILRLSIVAKQNASFVESLIRDVRIHGGSNTWFLEVAPTPACYRAEIGYSTSKGRFHAVARSNLVTTPTLGSTQTRDAGLQDLLENFDRIFAMSGGYANPDEQPELRAWLESRLQRPIGSPAAVRYSGGAYASPIPLRTLRLSVDADLLVHGSVSPTAHVTIAGEPVKIQPDGSFAVRFDVPDKRHVIPIVASSRDGMEQRTIVLAIERNTKILEPLIREPMD